MYTWIHAGTRVPAVYQQVPGHRTGPAQPGLMPRLAPLSLIAAVAAAATLVPGHASAVTTHESALRWGPCSGGSSSAVNRYQQWDITAPTPGQTGKIRDRETGRCLSIKHCATMAGPPVSGNARMCVHICVSVTATQPLPLPLLHLQWPLLNSKQLPLPLLKVHADDDGGNPRFPSFFTHK